MWDPSFFTARVSRFSSCCNTVGWCLGHWGPSRSLGGLCQYALVMTTLGGQFLPALSFHGPILGGPGVAEAWSWLRLWAVFLCSRCRPWPGFHRLPSSRGDVALLTIVGLLFLLHGCSPGTRQPGIKVATPSRRDARVERAMAEFISHEIWDSWGLGGCQRWIPFPGTRRSFQGGVTSHPHTGITVLGGAEGEAAGWKEAGAG